MKAQNVTLLGALCLCIMTFCLDLQAGIYSVYLAPDTIAKSDSGLQSEAPKDKTIQYSRVLSHAGRLKEKDPKKARRYAQEVFDSLKTGGSYELQAKALNMLGKISKGEKNYQEAQQYFQHAFTLSTQLEDAHLAIEALLNASEAQRLMLRYDEAKESVNNALKLAGEHENPELLIRCYITKGNVFRSGREYSSALASYNNALSLSQSYGDNQYVIDAHRKVAKTYSALEKFKLAIFHSQQALKIIEASPKSKKEDIAHQLELIASDQRRLGDLIPALKNARKALAIQRTSKNNDRIERLVLALATIHRKLGSYDFALRYANELLSIAGKNKDKEQILSANNQLALIYTHLEQYENAEDFYNKTLSQYEDVGDSEKAPINLRYKAAALRGLASVYTRQDKHIEALTFANQALSIYESLAGVSGTESASRLIGQIYFQQEMYDQSIDAFNLALSQSRSMDAKWSESSNLIHLGLVLAKKNQQAKAKKIIFEGLAIAENISAKTLVLMAYDSLMKIELKNDNFKLAFDYLMRQHKIVRKKSGDEVNQRIAELQILREMDLHERRIAMLERQSRIDSLELERKKSEMDSLTQKNTIKTLTLEKERTLRMFVISVIFLSLLVAVLLFSRLWRPKVTQKS